MDAPTAGDYCCTTCEVEGFGTTCWCCGAASTLRFRNYAPGERVAFPPF